MNPIVRVTELLMRCGQPDGALPPMAEITAIEPIAGEGFLEYYSQCLRYNPLASSKNAV